MGSLHTFVSSEPAVCPFRETAFHSILRFHLRFLIRFCSKRHLIPIPSFPNGEPADTNVFQCKPCFDVIHDLSRQKRTSSLASDGFAFGLRCSYRFAFVVRSPSRRNSSNVPSCGRRSRQLRSGTSRPLSRPCSAEDPLPCQSIPYVRPPSSTRSVFLRRTWLHARRGIVTKPFRFLDGRGPSFLFKVSRRPFLRWLVFLFMSFSLERLNIVHRST